MNTLDGGVYGQGWHPLMEAALIAFGVFCAAIMVAAWLTVQRDKRRK
jgi:hypothetical protein